MPGDRIYEELVRRITLLEKRLAEQSVQKHKYEILNPSIPAIITANQDNYAPGDYDVLFLQSDASRNLSGFSGGTYGRRLIINTYGGFNIVLLHNSVLSLAANRILTPTSVNITLTPYHSAYLIHTGTSWNVVLYV